MRESKIRNYKDPKYKVQDVSDYRLELKLTFDQCVSLKYTMQCREGQLQRSKVQMQNLLIKN